MFQMISKEQALEHISEVYEWSLTHLGFNHTMSRELFVWMQRTWAKSGTDRAQEVRRKVTAANKEKKTVSTGTTEAQAKGLTTLAYTKTQQSGATRFNAPLKQLERKPGSRIETPEEAQAEVQEAPPQQVEKKQKAAAVELTPDELAGIDAKSKPRAILTEFGEPRITATLEKVYGVSEDDMPGSGSQKAALLKQKVIEAGKKA